MAQGKNSNLGAFGKVFDKNVPHILESIFFSLDYDSFMVCHDVCSAWKYLFTSDSFKDGAVKLLAEKIRLEEMLYNSVESGNIEEVNHLLSIRVDPNCRTLVEYWNSGITPLYQAAFLGHKDIVKALIVAGANPSMANIVNGFTPLHICVNSGAKDAVISKKCIIRSLLDAGANPNIKHSGPFGGTTLRSALYQSSLDIIKLLLEAGADPSIDDGLGRTPLTAAKSTRMAAFRRTTLAHRVAAIMQSTCKELCKVGDCPIKRCFKSDEFPLIHRMMSMAAYHQRRYKSGPLSPVPGF